MPGPTCGRGSGKLRCISGVIGAIRGATGAGGCSSEARTAILKVLRVPVSSVDVFFRRWCRRPAAYPAQAVSAAARPARITMSPGAVMSRFWRIR
ncbi:hypothetical protein Acsp01_59880 [Actinoplanes sp. NBRC 101535]|nr:hypothetical protein Acsp01_59880 [Actinoplanes sp. NBRC 101535]